MEIRALPGNTITLQCLVLHTQLLLLALSSSCLPQSGFCWNGYQRDRFSLHDATSNGSLFFCSSIYWCLHRIRYCSFLPFVEHSHVWHLLSFYLISLAATFSSLFLALTPPLAKFLLCPLSIWTLSFISMALNIIYGLIIPKFISAALPIPPNFGHIQLLTLHLHLGVLQASEI